MRFRLVPFVGCAFILWMLAGCCATPGARARHHAEAFQKLSEDDRRLVLQGRVRRGMSTDAVYIAWGEPDEKKTAGDAKDTAAANETWSYERLIAVEAPFGSFDQWEPGSNLYGMTVPLAFRAGAGFGGFGNEGMLLYQPHLRIVDATFKRAEFIDGKLARYDLRQGRFRLAP